MKLYVDGSTTRCAYYFEGGQKGIVHMRFLKCTSNEGEYHALITGMRAAQRAGVTTLDIYSDSQLIVRQISGQYKTRKPELRVLRDRAVKLLKSFSKYTLSYVPREENPAGKMLEER